jgi:CRP-like cAMP-binding protein
MYAPLQADIARHVDLSESEWQALFTLFTPLAASRGTQLVQEGDVATHLYFIRKGAVQTYFLQKQTAVPTGFYLEYEFVTAPASYFFQAAAHEVVETLEDTELLCLEKSEYDLMNQALLKINFFTRALAEKFLVERHQHEALRLAVPRQRVRQLLLQHRQWIQRVPHASLAAFLDLSLADFTPILESLLKELGN